MCKALQSVAMLLKGLFIVLESASARLIAMQSADGMRGAKNGKKFLKLVSRFTLVSAC